MAKAVHRQSNEYIAFFKKKAMLIKILCWNKNSILQLACAYTVQLGKKLWSRSPHLWNHTIFGFFHFNKVLLINFQSYQDMVWRPMIQLSSDAKQILLWPTPAENPLHTTKSSKEGRQNSKWKQTLHTPLLFQSNIMLPSSYPLLLAPLWGSPLLPHHRTFSHPQNTTD